MAGGGAEQPRRRRRKITPWVRRGGGGELEGGAARARRRGRVGLASMGPGEVRAVPVTWCNEPTGPPGFNEAAEVSARSRCLPVVLAADPQRGTCRCGTSRPRRSVGSRTEGARHHSRASLERESKRAGLRELLCSDACLTREP